MNTHESAWTVHPTHEEAAQPLNEQQSSQIRAWTSEILQDENRLSAVVDQISATINDAAAAGHYILRRTPTDIAEKLRNGMAVLIPAHDANGLETFHYFWGITALVSGDLADRFPVMEGGSLISHPNRRQHVNWMEYRASHAVQLATELAALPDNSLVISTSRSLASKRAILGSGAVLLRRELFPMLDALTCDPGCLPGQDGRQAGVHNIIDTDCGDCIACPVNEAYGGGQIEDSCYLLADDPARAVSIEQDLQTYFNRQATLARAVLVEGVNYASVI